MSRITIVYIDNNLLVRQCYENSSLKEDWQSEYARDHRELYSALFLVIEARIRESRLILKIAHTW